MGFKAKMSLILLFFIVGIFFQNCGVFNSERLSSNSSQDSPDIPNLEKENFKAGDTFDPALYPYENDDIDFQEKLSQYTSLNGYKAIVASTNGYGLLAQTPVNRAPSQEDWSRALLERCEIQSGNQPCAILVEGNQFKYDYEEFMNAHANRIQVSDTFDPMLIPGVTSSWRDQVRRTYFQRLNAGDFMAFAIGDNGNSASGWSTASQDEANRRALEICETAQNSLCTLYAIGDTMVWDPANFNWEPRRVLFDTPKALVLNEIPFINDSAREGVFTDMVSNLNNGGHSVVAMGRYSRYFIVESANPITQQDRDQALETCNSSIPVAAPGAFQRTCFIYSVDMQVLMTWESFASASHSWYGSVDN